VGRHLVWRLPVYSTVLGFLNNTCGGAFGRTVAPPTFGKFLLLWAMAQLGIMLYALGFVFPRHYYLATVPSVLLWSYLIVGLLDSVGRRPAGLLKSTTRRTWP
jgi:hypothetical protein